MDITPDAPQRMMESLISNLSNLCGSIEQFAKPSPFPSQVEEKRIVFGGLIGFVTAYPEATARFIWRLFETGKAHNG